MEQLQMDFGGRKPLLKALVGSYNYNLNLEDSDKDYKLFILPKFDDLYGNVQFSKMYVGEEEDYDVHDIRKLNSLLWKSNINFIETLFSDNIEILSDDYNHVKGIMYFNLESIIHMRKEIARMNLPYLWNACIGMHIEKKKAMIKGTTGTQHLVDKFGYDTKQAMHSMRVLFVLQRFANNDFKDFKKAIYFEEDDIQRDYLLKIKNGIYPYKMMVEILNNELKYTELGYKNIYSNQLPDEETYLKLSQLVKEIVKYGIRKED